MAVISEIKGRKGPKGRGLNIVQVKIPYFLGDMHPFLDADIYYFDIYTETNFRMNRRNMQDSIIGVFIHYGQGKGHIFEINCFFPPR